MNLTRRSLAAGLVNLVPVAAAFAAPVSDPGADRAAAAALRRLIAEGSVRGSLNRDSNNFSPPRVCVPLKRL